MSFARALSLTVALFCLAPAAEANEEFDQVYDLVTSLEGDFSKFYDKGNKAAGTRVRTGMFDLSGLAQDIRVEIQALSHVAGNPNLASPPALPDAGNPFDALRDFVVDLEADFEKFYDKGNQAAGTRVRKGMQELKHLSQEIRSEVQAKKND